MEMTEIVIEKYTIKTKEENLESLALPNLNSFKNLKNFPFRIEK